MPITVSKKNDSIPDAMKIYAEDQLQAVIEGYPKIISASIILNMEKSRRFTAEVVIHGKNINYEADHEAFDLKEAIDTTIGNIDKQLRKHLDKVQHHHKPDHVKPKAEEDEEQL